MIASHHTLLEKISEAPLTFPTSEDRAHLGEGNSLQSREDRIPTFRSEQKISEDRLGDRNNFTVLPRERGTSAGQSEQNIIEIRPSRSGNGTYLNAQPREDGTPEAQASSLHSTSDNLLSLKADKSTPSSHTCPSGSSAPINAAFTAAAASSRHSASPGDGSSNSFRFVPPPPPPPLPLRPTDGQNDVLRQGGGDMGAARSDKVGWLVG